jgi:hypothetical protein
MKEKPNKKVVKDILNDYSIRSTTGIVEFEENDMVVVYPIDYFVTTPENVKYETDNK